MNKEKKIRPYQKQNNNEFSLYDIIILVAQNLKTVFLIPFFICSATIINVFFIEKPLFKSQAKIMSSSSSSRGSSGVSGLAAQFGFNIGNDQNDQKWVNEDVVKSRTLAKRMLKRKFDTKKFGKQIALYNILGYDGENTQYSIENEYSLATDDFLSMVSYSEDIGTGIHTITITSFESRFSADLVLALIEELDSHQQLYNKKKTIEGRKFIEERIVETEKELQMAEEKLKDFLARNRRIENSPALLLEQQRLSREVTVLIGVFTTLKQQLETTKIEEVKESEYVVILDQPEASIFPSSPKKRYKVLLSGLFGLSLSFIFIILKEYQKNMNITDKRKIKRAKTYFVNNLQTFLPNFRKKL